MKIKTKLIQLTILLLLSVNFVFADSPSDAAAKALSIKLKKDLALEKVTVRLSNINISKVSNSLISLRGKGKANDLNISFEVILNKTKLTPTEVDYEIIEPDPNSPLSDETLTHDLLNKLNQDYRTNNIVVAVDYFNIENIGDNQMKITGNGELRVDFDWKKFEFEIVKAESSKAPVTIKYRLY